MTLPENRRAMLLRLGLAAVLLCMVAATGVARGRSEVTAAEDEMALKETEIDWNTLEVGDVVTVTGKLAVYGSEPHTYLALAVDDAPSPSGSRLLQIEGELLGELYELQGRTVTVRGAVSRLVIGPGFPTVIEVQEFQVEEDR